MHTTFLHYFFPDLKEAEFRKFGILGIAAFCILGSYWLMRQLKQTIFFKIAFPEIFGWNVQQGALFQPLAKTLSPVVVLLILLGYSKLVDLVKKHQLFYVVCTFYGVIFAAISGVLLVRDWYGELVVGRMILAIVGWVSYFATESFGSLVVALFWSFTNSITDSNAAKRGFPFIITLAQLGAISGTSLLLFSESLGTIWPLMVIVTLAIFCISWIIYYFMRVIPADQLVGNKMAAASEQRTEGFFEGFWSGLTLLLTRPYLIGVFIISTFDGIVISIIEYQMDCQAALSSCYVSETAFCKFQGMFGLAVNTLAFFIALVGTSYFIKRLGTRLSLLVYPAIFATTLISLFAFFLIGNPDGTQLLWAIFIAMMIFKGLGYAFNNPVKEIMYIPTSKDAKFKTKGWIDMFGSRFAKAAGAQVTSAYRGYLAELMIFGSLFSFGIIGAWIVAALYVGVKNQQLIEEGRIIE